MSGECRLAQKRAGGGWPRSCPICGLSKTCQRGLEEVQLANGRFEIREARERTPACERCRFWRDKLSNAGECRRRAPEVLPGAAGSHGRTVDFLTVASRFPETHKADWCGEFEPAAKGDAA
ncbi:hypothetical protein [Phreatobacter oligotrophus]|uniref:Uncharacterized protein n=1 Tax=Phreatobacter oligotrophus TaxID=1122261 RepID=A0A2T4ZIV4_9HYPH|nr:hypothetical protein [Phreatobacter oligotrophus]PTM61917.1 hypothetical protein C8P69_101590 [Phreatobacter oligotrophus]